MIPTRTPNHLHPVLVATLIVLLGAGLRLALLSTAPVGLSADELVNAQLSQGIREGQFSVVYTQVMPAREGVYPALLAIFTAITGDGVLLWRLLSAWISLLSLAISYRMVREMLGERIALLSTALMAVAFWPVMLGRLSTHATLMPFLTALLLYFLLRSFDAEDFREASPWFTACAITLGVAQYVHYSAWALVLIALLYTLYRWRVEGRIQTFQFESLIYATAMTLVVLLPLLMFSVGQPQARLQTSESFARALINAPFKYGQSFLGIFLTGNADPLYHVPRQPALNFVMGALFLLGLGSSLMRWRSNRAFLAVIVVFVGLLPAAFAETGADVSYMAVIIPVVFVLVAMGVDTILQPISLQPFLRPVISLSVVAVTLGLTVYTLHFVWANLPGVEVAYGAETGQIARFLDAQSDDLPVSVCSLPVDRTEDAFALTNAELLDLLMHRQRTDLRVFNCTQSIVLAEGGAAQYFIFPRGHYYDFLPGALLGWMALADSVTLEHVSPDVVIRMDVQEQLANEVGAFITTSLTLWPPEEGSREFAELPVEFEGNVTFMGYEVRDPQLQGSDLLEIVTYWRLDGPPPPQVTMFAHLLDNPVVVLAQEDTIGVQTATLQSRDVFVQYNRVRLPESLEPGLYPVSVGMFFTETGERLTALDEGEPRANRLFLQRVEYSN